MFLNTEEEKPLDITMDEFHLLTNVDKTINQYQLKYRVNDKKLNQLITDLENKGIEIFKRDMGTQTFFRIPDHEQKEIKKKAVVNFYKQNSAS